MNSTIKTIEKGAFNGLNNLNELNLEENNLEIFDLKHLDIEGLRILKLGGNNFTFFDNSLSKLPSLQYLSIQFCNITRISKDVFTKNKNLIKIDLTENLLVDLKREVFENLGVLKELKLGGNNFSEIPFLALNISSLETLSLDRNKISSFEANKLNKLVNLKDLDLSGNRISSISGFASLNLSQLTSVDLSSNQLAALPTNFFHFSLQLKRIHLAENRFRQIPTSALSETTLPNLNWLNLTGNPLVRVHDIGITGKYPVLEEIYITHTNLTIVTSKDFESFPSLQHIYLGNNKISRISPGAFGSLPNLLTLDLRINELELLPQERLQGLTHLRLLNLTQNKLKELEEFPIDLKSLQILDLSYNHIGRIGKSVFQHLDNLVELYLFGNWISSVSTDAFKPLKKLRSLDLSRNYLENIPLSAFRPLETQIRSLRTEENPLSCSCDSHELWEWLRDHQKLVDPALHSLKCEHPPELRGRVFLNLKPEQFCDQPLIIKLAIQDIQPFSVLVSWQSRNHSGLHGYQVVYHSIDGLDEIRGKMLDRFSRATKLSRLIPGTRYLICVLALGNWLSQLPEVFGNRPGTTHRDSSSSSSNSWGETFTEAMLPLLVDSQTSKCTEVTTLGHPGSSISGSLGSGVPDDDDIDDSDRSLGTQSILTRRLGLIIGCCMGFVVFVVLVSVLGYLKVKKQRAAVKRDPPMPPEYISYRHFSIQSGETHGGGHPHFITSMNTTSLN
nr:carboxypeptidase N subunit 2-like [Onthophagus taurus]